MRATKVQEFANTTNSDVVGGVPESTLNKYSKKHFEQFPTFYKSAQPIEETALDIKFDYAVGAPVVFHLAQTVKKSDALKRRLLSDPLLYKNKGLFRATLSNPTVKIDLPATVLKFSAISTGLPLADVTLTGSVSAAILLEPASPGQYTLEVTSVDLKILSKSFSADRLLAGCDLNKLIEHILDAIFKDSLTRFIEALPLPQPHLTIVGLSLQLQSIAVQDTTLLLGLAVSQAQHRQLQTDTRTLSGETMERAVFGKELDRVMKPSPGALEGTMDLSKQHPALAGFKKVKFKRLGAGALPPGDLFVALSQNVFQLLANKYLNINVEKEHDSGGFAHYYYKYGYSVSNPVATIINSGIQFAAELAGNASGGAGLSGCSSALSASIGGDASAVPGAKINAELLKKNNGTELWIHPFDFPFAIVARAWINPDIGLLDFVLSLIVSALLSLFSAIVLPLISLGLEIKIVTLPATVPGTPVTAQPSIDTVGNWNGMLFISFDLKF